MMVALQHSNEITIKYLFLNPIDPVFEPRSIQISRELYSGPAQGCQELFQEELRDLHKFPAELDSIRFWRPKEPLSDMEENWSKYLSNSRRLTIPSTGSLLSRLTDIDDRNLVHLIVTAEGEDTGQFAMRTKFRGYLRTQTTPGEIIHDGRYSCALPGDENPDTVAPPIQLYHPVFDFFLDKLDDEEVQPSVWDLCETRRFMDYLSRIHHYGEEARNEGVVQRLERLVHPRIHAHKGVYSDASIFLYLGNTAFPCFLMKFMRELGEHDYDPSTYAGISMRCAWTSKDTQQIRDACCCPTFILAGGGPWLSVLGAVLPDKVIVQRLTDMKWLGISSTEEDNRIYHAARMFLALRLSLEQLVDYYEKLTPRKFIKNKPHPRYFPYPSSFPYKDSIVKFDYITSLENYSKCVTFHARVIEGDVDSDIPPGTSIVVKFVARYSKEAHEFLAKQKHAPALYYCGPILEVKRSGISKAAEKAVPGLCLRPNLMRMVVMEYIPHEPRLSLPTYTKEKLEAMLVKLHVEGYAFGDLRHQNILLDRRTGDLKLIDFNWCGPFDTAVRDEGLPEDLQEKIDANAENLKKDRGPFAYYPLTLSNAVYWPWGVGALGPIRPEHDWSMFRGLSWR